MEMDHQPVAGQLELDFDHAARSFRDVTSHWTVTIKVYNNRHVCTSLDRVDMGNRRVISEALSCQEVNGSARVEILSAAVRAVTESWLDAVGERP